MRSWCILSDYSFGVSRGHLVSETPTMPTHLLASSFSGPLERRRSIKKLTGTLRLMHPGLKHCPPRPQTSQWGRLYTGRCTPLSARPQGVPPTRLSGGQQTASSCQMQSQHTRLANNAHENKQMGNNTLGDRNTENTEMIMLKKTEAQCEMLVHQKMAQSQLQTVAKHVCSLVRS